MEKIIHFHRGVKSQQADRKAKGRQKAKTEEKKKPDNKSEKTAENKSEEEQISLFDVGMTV